MCRIAAEQQAPPCMSGRAPHWERYMISSKFFDLTDDV